MMNLYKSMYDNDCRLKTIFFLRLFLESVSAITGLWLGGLFKVMRFNGGDVAFES